MTQTYDKSYSTAAAFNRPILTEMLCEMDISKLDHWLTHGEPHKGLAETAVNVMIDLEWTDGLQRLWDAEWIAKKKFILTSWAHICHGFRDGYRGSEVENWIINKTYNENAMSKSEINNLHLKNLSYSMNSDSPYWDFFFTKDLQLKGALSEDIISSLIYFAFYKIDHNKAESPYDTEIMKDRLDRVISHKNGFNINPFHILGLLGHEEKQPYFWKILGSKMKADVKDLFIIGTAASMHFSFIEGKAKKKDDEFVDGQIRNMTIALKRLGLTDTVTFTVKDIEGDYRHYFDRGYIESKKLLQSGYSFNMRANHLEYVPTSYNETKKDVTFESGLAIFHKPIEYGYDLAIKEPTKQEIEQYIKMFSELRK